MPKEPSDTKNRLIASALGLFASSWYSSVSVAEICRAAGLSNGVFYRYFKSKEELILHILEDVIERIELALGAVAGDDMSSRLESMTDILFRFSAEHPDLITVFREGQYRFLEYERRLTDMYRRILSRILGRPAGVAEYLVGIGGLRFAAVRSALQGQPISVRSLGDMAAYGTFPSLSWDPGRVFGITVNPPAMVLSGSSRDRLLKAGKRLLGEKGYHAVNIHEITDAADLSVGAFYKHFDSKESFFREQILSVGREVRHFISSHLSPGLNRLETEMQGIFLFGVYLSLDHWCYDLVRECEFVAPDTAREYYEAFKRGYLRMGAEGMDQAAVASDPAYLNSAVEYLIGISHYFGLEVAFDESPHNARAIVEGIGDYLSRGLSSGR